MPAPGGVNANIFALLDDDENEDGAEAPQQKAPAQKPAAKKTEEHPKKETRERKPKDDRRPRGKGRDNEQASGQYDGSDKPVKPSDNEGRGKGRSRRYEDGEGKSERKGKGKGGRKREFDRHSGTGRGKGEAREGRGKYNWGEKGDQAPTEGAEGAEATNENDAENKAPAAEGEEAAPEPEEEENTMSFDDYMKLQADKAPVGPKLEERKITDNQGGNQAHRDQGGKEDEMYGMIFKTYDGKHHDREKKHAREGWAVADDVFNLKFADPNQGGGKGDRREGGKGKGKGKGSRDREDRGGSKGGRGAPRQPRQAQGKIELDDANAFPSLA